MSYGDIINKKFSFLGGGIIAGVFIERLLKAGVSRPDQIIATDPQEDRLEELRKQFGIQVSTDNRRGADFGDIVVLAMPAGVVKAVLSESCQSIHEKQIILSLAAAVPTWLIESVLCKPVPVVRAIPNTPSLVGEGMNPYCLGKHIGEADLPLIRSFLDVFGTSLQIEERLMNAATALTAVGPTYIFPVIKALRDASIKLGLSRDDAQRAAAQAVLGAASLVLQTGRTPEDLHTMISTRTLNEAETEELFALAVTDACGMVSTAEKKLTE
ncbi:MAG: pyrroline-5-carboxylate reductase dimerization domain-containing protein [Bacteroidota bacterium]